MMKYIVVIMITIAVAGCSGGGASDAVSDNNVSSGERGRLAQEPGVSIELPADTPTGKPMAVYNAAYQENYSADSIGSVISNAKNAYVLVDPFEDEVYKKIAQLKKQGNQIGGYISAGTGENWREDYNELKPFLTKKEWSEWPGEFYVSDTAGVLPVMKKRIDKLASWGLDWVEFDNMDWMDEEIKRKFSLKATISESQEYVNSLCAYAHTKGLKCMAKNSVTGFKGFDGVLYESFSDNKNWWEIMGTRKFLREKKPVIINHYNESDCDKVYAWYKNFYSSENISFICEDKANKKYKHYNQ